jgi:hypothetical protein
VAVYEELAGRIDEQVSKFERLIEAELPALNARLGEAKFSAIMARA